MMPNVQAEIHNVIEKLLSAIELRLDQAKPDRFATLDVDDMFLRYANAIVFSCFYKQDQVVDFKAKVDPTTKMIEDWCQSFTSPLIRFCMMFPVLRPILNWLMLRFHPIGVMRNRIMTFVKQQTLLNFQARQQMAEAKKSHDADGTKGAKGFDADNFILKSGSKFRRNLIDYVTDQFHDGKLTTTEYLHNAFFLFLASTKTSADAISKLLYNLASNPEEQEKLRASVLAEGVESEYLHWSIMESLRLFPPAPVIFRRLSYDMTTKDGILVPGGTMVYALATLTNRLTEYWGQDADEYKPERWSQASSFHPAQFMAFGVGKRKCFGGDFAVAEMKMLMKELLTRYRFKCSPGTNAETILDYDTFIAFTTSNLPVNLEVSRVR